MMTDGSISSTKKYQQIMWQKFQKFFRVDSRTIYLYCFIVGILSGFAAIIMTLAIDNIAHYAFEVLGHFPLPFPAIERNHAVHFTGEKRKWVVFFLPILGGLLTGLCVHFLDHGAAGGGTEQFLDAFHNKGGVLPKRTTVIKLISSVFTIGLGGSGGREGPMSLVGAGLGSIFGRFIKMGARAQRTLLLAGAAGGLGAIFRIPLGGAITAIEVLYKEDFETDALVPCIISSVTAYTVFISFMGVGHVFSINVKPFVSPVTLIFFAILAVICSMLGFLFVKVFHFTKNRIFDKIPLHPVLKPALGGLLLSCLVFVFPEVLRSGHGVIQDLLDGELNQATWQKSCLFFFMLGIVKMFATSFTTQSGGSAGTLIPSLYIGAMLGGAVGILFQRWQPALVPSITPFIIVGMASFFAAVTNASLGALIMVSELTGGYDLLPPLMVVCAISLIFTHRWSLYKNQVKNKFASQAHSWDLNLHASEK